MKQPVRRLVQGLRTRVRSLRDRIGRWWRARRRTADAWPARSLRLKASAVGGRLRAWPLVGPERAFDLHLPAGIGPGARMPLLVWIHGCRQDAAGFAAGTRIREHADRHGVAVLMPDQTRLANPMRCWNWFDPATADGAGEAAIVGAQVDAVCARHDIDPDRIWVAGLSSGAALAATIAVHAPQRFAALACHSGLPAGAARGVREARAAMLGETARDVAALGAAAHARGSGHLPVLVLQGTADATVAPVNADRLVTQALALNGGPALGHPPPPDRARRYAAGTREVEEADWLVDGRLAARRLLVDGLGHAWSGGDDRQPFFDAAAPDATATILEFFVREGRRPARATRTGDEGHGHG